MKTQTKFKSNFNTQDILAVIAQQTNPFHLNLIDSTEDELLADAILIYKAVTRG